MKAAVLSPTDLGVIPVDSPGTAKADASAASLRRMLSRPRRAGMITIVAFVASFGAWGAVAPLAGGAIATGTVVPASGVKTLRHPDGGVVHRLHVREGDDVSAGTPLVTFSDASVRGDTEALADRRLTRLAEAARLEAELGRLSAPRFPTGTGPVRHRGTRGDGGLLDPPDDA
jgi:HlyD family secretion protein/epimerase transport system membrane fusion protein